MKANPIYEFKATTDLGVDMVPVGALILIEDSDGAGTPKLVRKLLQGALVSTSTIADFLNDVSLFKEIGGATPTPATINGGIY